MLYKLIPDYDVIGDYPQAIWTDYFDVLVLKQKVAWRCPDFKFTPRGKLTDYVFHSAEGYGTIISHSFWDILSEFKISEHQRFDVNLIKRGKVYNNYYYIHFVKSENFFSYIDWENSKLHKYYNHSEKLELMHFSSYKELDDYEQSILDTKYQIGGEVALKNLDLDFINFRFPFFPQGVVCSELCKEALESANLTGFKFDVIGKEEK